MNPCSEGDNFKRANECANGSPVCSWQTRPCTCCESRQTFQPAKLLLYSCTAPDQSGHCWPGVWRSGTVACPATPQGHRPQNVQYGGESCVHIGPAIGPPHSGSGVLRSSRHRLQSKAMDRWMSGLSHTPGKRARGKTLRGFESRLIRQNIKSLQRFAL